MVVLWVAMIVLSLLLLHKPLSPFIIKALTIFFNSKKPRFLTLKIKKRLKLLRSFGEGEGGDSSPCRDGSPDSPRPHSFKDHLAPRKALEEKFDRSSRFGERFQPFGLIHKKSNIEKLYSDLLTVRNSARPTASRWVLGCCDEEPNTSKKVFTWYIRMGFFTRRIQWASSPMGEHFGDT